VPDPAGLALSPDGSLLFAASLTDSNIYVLDPATLVLLRKIPVPFPTYEIVAGLDSRLYAATAVNGDIDLYAVGVMQVDYNAGVYQRSVGGFWPRSYLQISPDRKTLYIGDQGVSPGQIDVYDVSGMTSVWIETYQDQGGSGEGLTLSNSGDALYFPCSCGNADYGYTSKFRASGITAMGNFDTRDGVGPLALSNDDRVAFITNSFSYVGAYDTQTFAWIGGLYVDTEMDGIRKLAVDPSGRYLFVNCFSWFSPEASSLEVYSIPSTSARVDVLPRKYPNYIPVVNRRTQVQVAILSDAGFDATSVDVSTLTLWGIHSNKRPLVRDIDRDGDKDLVLEFCAADMDLWPGMNQVTMNGVTRDGRVFAGGDNLVVGRVLGDSHQY
jgi:DNA-binding beta-propeller fold protein YncE